MSKIVRSADWVKAQYASMRDQLLQYGEAEQPAATSLVWSNVALGGYALSVVAYDNYGVCVTSAVVNITVNDAPVTTLSAPANGTIYPTAPASIAVTVEVENVAGTITNVSIYTNGVFWSTGNVAWAGTYTNTWANPPAGTNVLTAVAIDSYGAAGTSAVVSIWVNAAPQASIVTPTNNAVITSNTVTLSADVSDSEGTVVRVDFYSGTNRLSNTNWLDGYCYRQKLTVTNLAEIGSDQTNFPLLVKFTGANFDFAAADADGHELRFTAGDEVTLLSYERERHDAGNEAAEYWVKLPVLSSGASTEIYVYYNNFQEMGDGADPTNVWDSDYLFVQHLGEAVSGCAWDSTANSITGTLDAVTLGAEGYIAGAGEFLHGNGIIELASFPTPSNATMEAWLKTDRLYEEGMQADYMLRVAASGTLESCVSTASGTVTNFGAGALTTGTWRYVADVYGSQGRTLYVDGAPDGTNADTGFPTSAVSNVRSIGEGFAGLLDEVRMSKIVRSEDWVRAQSASMRDQLLQYGEAEQPAATSLIWSNVAPGNYALSVVAYDNYGICITSAVVNITVNDAPNDTLLSPVNAYLRPPTASIVLTDRVYNVVGTITNVGFYTNGTLLATGKYWQAMGYTNWYTNVWANPAPGRYAMDARGWDNYGALGISATNTVLVWTNRDIGSVGKAGSAAYTNLVYWEAGAGVGITGTADACRFVYLPMTGNCTIVARVTNFTGTASGARAGVMMRESTNKNAREASSLFMPANNRVYFHRRTTTGGTTTMTYSNAVAAPYWVKLERSNSVFTAYGATNCANGAPGTWIRVGTNAVTMTNPIQVGLTVTSGSTSNTRTGVFDNVSITAP